MGKKSMFLLVVLAMALGSVAQAANIIWVSDNKGFSTVEPNKAADQGWVDLLTLQGHNVIYKNQFEYIDGTQYWRTLDPNKVAELEAADLIILSRNADSGSYSTAADNEPNKWNAVTTPILSLSAHMSRVGKWGWLNSTGTVLAKEGLVTVVDPTHAVFAGVTIDPNNHVQVMSNRWNADWASVIKDAGNGKVLATRASDGLVSIATWEAGQKYFEGSLFTAGGPRMLFVAGTGSKNNVAPDIAPDGMFNLTADGERMFLNAVNYMLNKGKKVVFVSATYPSATDANVPGDKGFVDLLRGAGYQVDYAPGTLVGTGWVSYWETLDPNKLAVLDAADLVIIARGCNSAGMATDAAEKAAWCNVKTPLMLMSSYIAASNRWEWINTTNQSARESYYLIQAVDVNHPIFAGVNFEGVVVQWFDPNVASGYASFPLIANAGSGTVLAVKPDTGNMMIAEWLPGQPFYATSTQTPVDRRMLFNAGTQEISGQKVNWGVMNLNAEGQKIFLNAVKYLLTPPAVVAAN